MHESRSEWMAWLILAMFILSGCTPPQESLTANQGAKGAEASNEPLPSETAGDKVEVIPVDFVGFEAQVQKLAGRLVLVDVWSTGCPPCMREYPHLVALSQRSPDQIVCVSYNVDYIGQKTKPVESYLPKVTAFLKQQNSVSVINLISSEADSDIFEKLDIASIPVVLLYGRDGKLLKKFTEANSGEDGLTYDVDIIPAIEAALK